MSEDIKLRAPAGVADTLEAEAKELLKKHAAAAPEPYYTGPDFEPHQWAVNAVMDALSVKVLVESVTSSGDLVRGNSEWFVATGQMPERPQPDIRQTAFYLGMQCEELAEKLEVVFGTRFTAGYAVKQLDDLATALKRGDFDAAVARAMHSAPTALLDGDVDLLWVTVGAMRAMGSDPVGAYGAVAFANWNKQFPDGTFHRDATTGKVLKPEGWQSPDMEPFVHPDLRG